MTARLSTTNGGVEYNDTSADKRIKVYPKLSCTRLFPSSSTTKHSGVLERSFAVVNSVISYVSSALFFNKLDKSSLNQLVDDN
jgi:hypothetical protein